MQSTVLQNELQPETENRTSFLGEIDESYDRTVTEKISKLETDYSQKCQRLEQQKYVLVSNDLLQMNGVKKSIVPCQYCGSADHQTSTCPHGEMSPMCKTKNHSLKYICPILKDVKKQERDNRGYRDENHPEQVYQLNDGAANVQVTLM